MAVFSRLEVYKTIELHPIVPVFYHNDIEVVKQVVEACYNGGVRVFEFTNRGDFAHEIFTQLIPWVNSNFSDLIIGIGSIVDAPTAAQFIQCGANFIVGPILNPEVAKICNRRQIGYIPGCGSATEVSYAQELGVEIVKVFPAGNVGGPSFVKNILGPMPWSKVMVTGGVTTEADNLKAWFKAGISCVGIGSNLFPKEIIQSKDWAQITCNCREVFEIVSN